jgi:tetratricopeptide (TPR) repeat protein
MTKKLAALVLFLLLAPRWTHAADLKILVFPLEGTCEGGGEEWLNEGIVYSVTQQLEIHGVEVIGRKARTTLIDNLDLPSGAQLSHASMIRIAQRASADILVMGALSGGRQNLRVSLKTLDLKTLRLSGDMVANGPLATLTQMENELAWMILNNMGLTKSISRQKFQLRTRKTPNQAYSLFIESFGESKESARIDMLLKALEIHRDFQDALLQLSGIFFRKGNCTRALPYLNRMRNNGSGFDADRDFMLGSCYLQDDSIAQSIPLLTNALTSSRTFEKLNNLAVAQLRRGEWGPAWNSLSEAKNLSRGDSTIALNMAIARHLQGNDFAGKNIIEESIRMHSYDGMLYFIQGVLLQAQGDKEKATGAFQKAKLLGIGVEKLQNQAPKNWARIIFDWQPS